MPIFLSVSINTTVRNQLVQKKIISNTYQSVLVLVLVLVLVFVPVSLLQSISAYVIFYCLERK